MDIYSEILDEKKVSKKEHEELLKKTDAVLKELQDELNRLKLNAEVMLGGSAAKGTFVKGDFDCDVFIRFDKEYEDKKISGYLARALKIFKGIDKVHGSRDYFQGKIEGINYEFVPVKRISEPSEAFNVTDCSPLHVKWMEENIKSNPELTNQIILTKLFCKAQRIYGAESYIKGFSGHVIDILVAYYKTFEELLKNSSEWQKGTIIDIENHKTGELINESKINSLIVIDPIQPLRNAAAALSVECMEIFKKRSKEFLKKPSKDFFEKKEITVDGIKLKKDENENELFVIEATPLKGKEDVVGTKILKVFEHIKRHLELHEFSLIDWGWEWDKKEYAIMWFVTKPEELAQEKLREGPPVHEKKDADRFMKKHSDYFIENNRLCAYVKRDFTKAEDLIRHLIDDEYVKQRTKSIELRKI